MPRISACVNIYDMNTKQQQQYCKARSAYIARQFSHLNNMQRKAVLATEGPLIILAGAGSGKTTVLINRIANLLWFGRASDTDEMPESATEEDIALFQSGSEKARERAALDPVAPWRILAITFTNKAAGELKDRLCRLLGEQGEDIWAFTFHSFCVRVLRRDAILLGYPENFTIYDTSDSLSVIKSILKDRNLTEKEFPPRQILSEISRAKDNSVSSDEYASQHSKGYDSFHRTIAEVYAEYQKRLFVAGAMDFDDLLALTVRLLQENADVAEYWQKKFQYILVDEYQDTNRLQYLLISILSEGWRNICVVGDDDQSIYKFRGATIENILHFEDEFKPCRTVRLEQNYRSTGHILDAANSVIANNSQRKQKTLWTQSGAGDRVIHCIAHDQDDEANYIAGQILNDVKNGGSWKENCILYRMNAQSNALEQGFRRLGVPYRILGGNRFYDRAEVKDILSYLSVVQTPEDNLRLLRIINNPPRGIGMKTISTLQQAAADRNLSLFDTALQAEEFPELQKNAGKLKKFTNLIQDLRKVAEKGTAEEVFDETLEKTGYLHMLQEKNTVENKSREENILEIKSSILSYTRETGDASLSGFLESVALFTDTDNYDKDADCVVMMTIHSAKGLEFHTVFLAGAEDGIFPGYRNIGETEKMEEERRLCYVAITRAKRKLYITSARERMLFGNVMNSKPSRFIGEIPDEHMETIKTQAAEQWGNDFMNEPQQRNLWDSPKTGTPFYRSHGNTGRQGYRANRVTVKPLQHTRHRPEIQLATGNRIRHQIFGEGTVTDMQPMGSDYLVSIHFEDKGDKKFMLSYASQYLVKLD